MIFLSKRELQPTESKEKKPQSLLKDGKIPIRTLFDKIYETVATKEAKEMAPSELKVLKTNLDGVLEQMDAIAKKIKRPEQPQ